MDHAQSQTGLLGVGLAVLAAAWLAAQLPQETARSAQGTIEAERWEATDVTVNQAPAMIDAGALVVDVRDVAVSAGAHLPGALLIPLGALQARFQTMQVATTQPVVVYCGNGSALGHRAVRTLSEAGYTNVVNLRPGLSGWRDAGLPTSRS